MYLFSFSHAVPRKYTTGELIDLFEKRGNVDISDDLKGTINDMAIRERGGCIDFDGYFREDNPRPESPPYTYFAEAMRKSLEKASLSVDAVTGLVTSSSTSDYVAPSTSSLIVPELQLDRGITHYHLGGMGCAGSVFQLNLLSQVTKSCPDQLWLAGVGDFCLTVLPTIEFFRDRRLQSFREIIESDLSTDEKKSELQRTNYFLQIFLFSGAAVSYLAAGESWWKKHKPSLSYARITRFKALTNLKPRDSKAIYFTNGLGADPNVVTRRINYHMGKEVVALIPRYGRALIEAMPKRDWRQVFIHLGSHKILRKMQATGGWSDAQMRIAYETLAYFGNVSQATVPLMWDAYMDGEDTGEHATLSISFGIGFSAAAAELIFHKK